MWLSSNALFLINVVTLRQAQLLLGWVNINHLWAVNHLGM